MPRRPFRRLRDEPNCKICNGRTLKAQFISRSEIQRPRYRTARSDTSKLLDSSTCRAHLHWSATIKMAQVKPMRLKITAVIVCVVALAALVLSRTFDMPRRFEIPGGFKGWFLVHYGDPNCPPLRRSGLFLVVYVPTSDRVCTSTSAPNRLVRYRFEYVYPSGTREPLRWDDHGEAGVQAWMMGFRVDDNTQEVFVGSEAEMNHSGSPPSR
jgi:hypothetical protein